MMVRLNGRAKHYRTVSFDSFRNRVCLVEQRKLPHRFEIIATRDFRETARAIRDMIVRGAGAIGATAAYGLAQGAVAYRGKNRAAFFRHIHTVCRVLEDARPTAVDPVNAMKQLRRAMRSGRSVEECRSLAIAAAEQFASCNIRDCEAIGRNGAKLIRNGMRILTHCNAGWLAFVDVGTATAPLYAAQKRGRSFHVYCDETRPRSQGATLTAWELSQQRISHEIIVDGAAGHLMQRGEVDLVIVGSDRILGRTGEVTNKIGTYSTAVLAHRHGIPFYVAAPLSTLDWNLRSGRRICIEERSSDEVLGAWGVNRRGQHEFVRVANPNSSARNPGFDVTPPELITGIITPAGIFEPSTLWSNRELLAIEG